MSAGARIHQAVLAGRRARFRARLAVASRVAGARIDVRIHRTARIGRSVRVQLASGTTGTLHVGAHSSLGDDVEIRLTGGQLRIGDWVEVRRGAAFMVTGTIDIVGPNLISWGTVVHCDEHVLLDRHAVASEHVTITDSTHQHAEGSWHLDTVTTAPVRIGADTWIGAKATITSGVTVGSRCVVAAGAVVTRDVPDDHVARGVPAQATPR